MVGETEHAPEKLRDRNLRACGIKRKYSIADVGQNDRRLKQQTAQNMNRVRRMMQCLSKEGLREAVVAAYEVAAGDTGVGFKWEVGLNIDSH